MKHITKAAYEAAGGKKHWITKYERKAFVNGYIRGAKEWSNTIIITHHN